MKEPITVDTVVAAPLGSVWERWNNPEHITEWAFAQDDWEVPSAENDVRTGGRFKTVMAAKDKSASFDFSGVYTNVVEQARLEYDLDDGRHVVVVFNEVPEGVQVTVTFAPEDENSPEVQRSGWQAILNNFKKYAERGA